MPLPIVSSAIWQLPDVATPSDGDAVTMAAVKDNYLQRVCNSIEYLAYSGRRERVQLASFRTPTNWVTSGSSVAEGTWEQNSVASTGVLQFELRLPRVGTCTSIVARLKGAAGHAGLPGTMPALSFDRTPVSTGVRAQVATVSDPSASTAAYQAMHTVTLAVSETLNPGVDNNIYTVRIAGEAGANALTGLLLTEVYAVVVE